MKKLLILLVLAALMVPIHAQGLLSKVPDDLFSAKKTGLKALGITHTWIPRFNTGVVGVSFGKNYGPAALSAVGFGIGYLRYKESNGVPFNDIGVNLMYLKNTADNGSGIGIYFTYNITDNNSLLNVGTHYDFFIKKQLIDTGITFHF